MKVILLYNVSKDLIEAYKSLESLKDFVITTCSDRDLDRKFSDVFLNDGPLVEDYSIDKPFFMMGGIDKDDYVYIKRSLKEAGLKMQGIKVMLTNQNKDRSLRDVMEEVKEEDEIMSKVALIRYLILKSENLNFTSEEKEIISRAHTYILDNQFTIGGLEKIKEALIKIKEVKKLLDSLNI